MPERESPDTTRRALLKGALAAGVGLAGLPGCAAPPVPAGPMLDVRALGAKGDGSADDTSAIQKAFDAAVATGGHVHIPSGRYRVTRSIKARSAERIDVTGAGWSSVLLHEADEPLLLWDTGVSCRESSIRDLCFTSAKKDKSPSTPVIACLGGAERSFFQHLLFNTEGARMGGGVSVENVMDTVTFDQCLLWGPVGGTGIRVAQGSEVRIFGGRILGSADPFKGLDSGNVGIHLTGNNGGVHIVGTDIIGLHTGLLIGSPAQTSNREIFITHATFDSSTHGIRQIDGAYTSIAGCWAASSDEDQILLEETANGAILSISGGTIFNGGAYGRKGGHNGLVVRAGSFMCTGVTVRNNKGTGILVGPAVRDYTVTGCRIVENKIGAALDGDRYAFTGNVVTGNGINLTDLGGPKKIVENNVR